MKKMSTEERKAFDQYVGAIAPGVLAKFPWEMIKTNPGQVTIAITRLAGEMIKGRRFEMKAKKE